MENRNLAESYKQVDANDRCIVMISEGERTKHFMSKDYNRYKKEYL